MCRWVAYAGPEIYLEDLIFHQEHSIVNQSLAANQSAWVTNGDGFGAFPNFYLILASFGALPPRRG